MRAASLLWLSLLCFACEDGEPSIDPWPIPITGDLDAGRRLDAAVRDAALRDAALRDAALRDAALRDAASRADAAAR
jgi:hypothetical protein